MQTKTNPPSTYKIFFSSAISSIISTIITNPIQVAKLNVQYYPSTCPQYPHSNFRELIGCDCSNFSVEGSIRSLKVVLPQVTISNILYMSIYQNRRHSFKEKYQINDTASTLAATFVARLFVSSVMLPIQVLRVQLSNTVKTNSNFFNFKSLKITLIRDMVYSAMFWLTLEKVRNWYISGDYRHQNRGKLSPLETFKTNIVPSLIAGSLISAITTPIDTVKTRVQSGSAKSNSVLKEMTRIYKNQKMMGLFSGVHFRVLKNSLHSSLYIILFQSLINRMSNNASE